MPLCVEQKLIIIIVASGVIEESNSIVLFQSRLLL